MKDGVNGSCHGADHHLRINKTRFPDFAAMNSYAHALNLTSSWYLNQDVQRIARAFCDLQ